MTGEPRSWLFSPADSEKKVASAQGGDADAVILDLEDSVAPDRKAAARAILSGLGARPAGGPQRWIRVNPVDSPEHGEDLACCRAIDIDGIVLPKAQSGADVSRLAADLAGTGVRIHAIVTETAASLFALDSYRAAAPTLAAMSWGAEDLSAALGASAKTDSDGGLSFTYRMARSLCLAGAVAAGVQPVDGVFADFRDGDGLRDEARAAAREGFTGKLAIHPAQVPIINAAFTPTPAEADHARAIVTAFDAQPGAGVLAVDGKMVDRPHLVQARRILARYEQHGG